MAGEQQPVLTRQTYMANGIASGDHRKAGIRNQPQMPDMNDTM